MLASELADESNQQARFLEAAGRVAYARARSDVAEELYGRPCRRMTQATVRAVRECHLCGPQRGRRIHAAPQFFMHTQEEWRHVVVIDFPQCAYDIPNAGREKCASDTRHAFDMLRIAAHRAAPGENDELRPGEIQRSDCICCQGACWMGRVRQET